MKNITLLFSVLSIMTQCLHAIPNFYDPHTIIDSDYCWFFRINPDAITIACNYPAMGKELLNAAHSKLENFKHHAQAKIKNNTKDHGIYEKAIQHLKQCYELLRKNLETSCKKDVQKDQPCMRPLTSADRDSLQQLLSEKSEKILSPTTKWVKKLPRMGQMYPDIQVYQQRADIEQQYADITQKLTTYSRCPTLSKKDKKLIAQTRKHVDNAYTAVVKQFSIYNPKANVSHTPQVLMAHV